LGAWVRSSEWRWRAGSNDERKLGDEGIIQACRSCQWVGP
jgi:hypothetical protein